MRDDQFLSERVACKRRRERLYLGNKCQKTRIKLLAEVSARKNEGRAPCERVDDEDFEFEIEWQFDADTHTYSEKTDFDDDEDDESREIDY